MKNKNTFVITNNTIMVDLGEETPRTIFKENPNYPKLKVALSGKNVDDINWEVVKTLTSVADVEQLSEGRMRKVGENIEVQLDDGRWSQVPQDLNDTMQKFLEKGHTFEPLVQFAVNLLRNPSKRSVEQLFKFLKVNRFTLTDDGCFIAYKAVRHDFLDIHSGTMNNSPGTTVRMPRIDVNDNPNETCSSGLHCAHINYAKNFGGRTGILVFVKVNPEHVVSVPVDYNFEKMRVCEYFVLGIAQEEIKEDILGGNKSITYSPEAEEFEKFEA